MLARLDRLASNVVGKLTMRPGLAALTLGALTLVIYLPGVIALPPVDRTEVVYAGMAKDMAASGDWLDAKFNGTRFQYRPIGVTWLQAGVASTMGDAHAGEITTYRWPSLAAAILAVVAIFGLLRPVTGDRAAFMAAALVAVSPIFAVQAQLAIPEGPLLATMFVAQLCLLRLYCAKDGEPTRGLALLFWAAQGGSVLFNALSVPILSLTTLVGLYVFDRRLSWLKRLHALVGLPVMALLAAPWLLVRAHVDGIPFAGMSLGDVLKALDGAQAMKWRALPGTFTLGLFIAALPVLPVLLPAAGGLWRDRYNPLPRFLMAWIAGYLVYLEVLSTNPALYTVQAMLPAVMLGAVLSLRPSSPGGAALPIGTIAVPPWLSAVLGAALPVAVLGYAREWPSPLGAAAIALTAALFWLAALALRERRAAAWLAAAIAGFGSLFVVLFGIILPGLDTAWPTRRIAQALAPYQSCAPGTAVVGLREPSAIFTFGGDAVVDPERAALDQRRILVVESRWQTAMMDLARKRGTAVAPPVACFEALDVMRGCRLKFSVHVPASASCPPTPQSACSGLGWPWPGADAIDTRCR